MADTDANNEADPDAARDVAPIGGTRAEAIQRLQIGLSGIAAMILLVGLANVIQDRAQETDESSVLQAAPATEPAPAPPRSDPLADAGVVPDLPAGPSSDRALDPALVPEQGDNAQTQ